LICGFWLPLWYLFAIVLSVLLWYADSDYLFGIFKHFLMGCYIYQWRRCESFPALQNWWRHEISSN
jgi:hypothetical protein